MIGEDVLEYVVDRRHAEPIAVAVDALERAIVHHGGAGTTAVAARSATPQVITPMFSDQFYWASRIVELGLGATTPHTTLTEQSLTAALRAALDPGVADRARTLSNDITRDGAEVATRRLESDYGA